MGWRVYGIPYGSGELSDTTLYQPFRPNKNILIRTVRTWFIIFNDPVFTSLNAKIYATDFQVEDGTFPPTKLLQTSDSRTKASIHTDDYGIKETYFTFSPTIELESSTWYALVINASGYTPTSNSYIAWKHSYPDPVLETLWSPSRNTVNKSPFQIYFEGANY